MNKQDKVSKVGFMSMGPKTYDKFKSPERNHHMKSAFTLIELIVVMAVIGILVLLAAPKFLGYSDKARTTQIINDIKVLENKIDEYLINHGEFDTTFLGQQPGDGQLYDRTGKISTKPTGLNIVPVAFYPETKLVGRFYSDNDGTVIYEDDKLSETVQVGPVYEAVPEYAKDKIIPEGDGTELDPYQLWYLENFDWIDDSEENMYAHYIVMRDLDFNDERHYIDAETNKPLWTENSGWKPIEFGGGMPFFGTLNGDGSSLFNLFINRPDSDNVGLFKQLQNSNVYNFNILEVNVSGNNLVGTLAGTVNNSAVTDAKYSGRINGSNEVGGAFGVYYGADLSNIVATHTVIATGDYVGGLAGSTSGYSMTGNTVEIVSNVSGNNYVGGVVGMASNNYTYNEIAVEGIIIGTGNNVGGLFGSLSTGSEAVLKKADFKGDVSGINVIGGFAGHLSGEDINVENLMIQGDISGASWVGGAIGEMHSSIIGENLTVIGTVSGTGEHTGGMFGEGTGSYTINEINIDGTVSGNILVGGIGGTILGNFLGEANVSGDIIGHSKVGGYAGYSSNFENNIHRNVFVNADISGTDRNSSKYIGGFIGHADGSQMGESMFEGNISGGDYIGGAYGSYSFNGEVSNIYVNSKIDGVNNVGGLTGMLGGGADVNNSIIIGSIFGEDNFDSLVGIYEDESMNSNVFTNVFYNDTNSQGINLKGTRLTESEMKDASLFWGFDTGIWRISDGEYPIIKK